MSNLFARISESARKTIATARGHKSATVDVSTHTHRIETRIVKSNGVCPVDNEYTFVVTLVGLHSGNRICLTAGSLQGEQVIISHAAETSNVKWGVR